jgi:hypothetical protein
MEHLVATQAFLMCQTLYGQLVVGVVDRENLETEMAHPVDLVVVEVN